MDFIRWLFRQSPHLLYQFFSIPFALLFYILARLDCLTLTHRYVYLMSGGCVLAAVTMGPYACLLLVPAFWAVLLFCSLRPWNVHPWVLGTLMCWQTFWHFLIQYQEYWLLQPSNTRLLLTMSAMMLLTQRATSVSMDLQEGKAVPPTCVAGALPYLSYTLYFPGLLGGPLCSFSQFVRFVEKSGSVPPPPPSPLRPVLLKCLMAFSLEWARRILTGFLVSHPPGLAPFWAPTQVLWVWAMSVALRMRYYSHWALSDALNNAAGLGFGGHGHSGAPLWDSMSDGEPWTVERSSRLSEYARRWNGTTAAWLRRLVFQRCKVARLALTFGFSAWWHGLHPGQVLGFLVWAAAVQADYRVHRRLRPLASSPGKRLVYTCLSWAQTQLVITWVVVAVELRNISSVWLLCRSRASWFPVLHILLTFFMIRNIKVI
uniref:Membrane bound O-acyltransferase domain containing 4 n=1 Tax=Scleropages formosus TaxID=113540 RepID=A0A8C9TW13_SCLFO